MGKAFNLLRGYVEVEAAGAFPERLLNLCAQERLPFWRLRWQEDGTSFVFRVYLQDRRRLDGLAERAMCELTDRERRGAAVAALALAKRWGFVAGLGLCLLAAGFFSRFLLVIEVTGNETVPTAVILSQLSRAGVRVGAYGPAIDRRAAANEVLLRLPELSWLAVNITGTRAEVSVREAEERPELLDELTPADVVAAEDGIIVDIQTQSGQALFADGDIVAKGETLIAGRMDLREPPGVTEDQGWLVVRAVGSVTARTWRTLEETIPLSATVKEFTGEEQTLYSLLFLDRRMDFFQNSSISGTRYDKITETKGLTLFGRELPVWLETAVLRGYTLREVPVDPAAEEARLRELLLSRLERMMAAGRGEVLRTDFVSRIEGGRLTVTLLAECVEEIGRTVELPGETGRVYAENAAGAAE